MSARREQPHAFGSLSSLVIPSGVSGKACSRIPCQARRWKVADRCGSNFLSFASHSNLESGVGGSVASSPSCR